MRQRGVPMASTGTAVDCYPAIGYDGSNAIL